MLGILDQVGSADKKTFEFRKLSLIQVGVRAVQNIAHHETQDGIAEKLELFVVLARLLVGMRTVGQRLCQQLLVGKAMPDFEFEFVQSPHKQSDCTAGSDAETISVPSDS